MPEENKGKKRMSIIDENLSTKDVHAIIAEFFMTPERGAFSLLHGTLKEFKYRMICFVLILLFLRFIFLNSFPRIADAIVGLVLAYLMIEVLIFLVTQLDMNSRNEGLKGIGKLVAVFFVVVFLMVLIL